MAAPTAPTTKMTLFKPVFIDQRVTLSPTEVADAAGKIDEHITMKLRGKLEEQCCTHGYVRPGSIQLLARSMGQAEHGLFTNDFVFQCKVRMMCLLPYADQIMDARILKVNKLGAYALIVDEGRLREAMRVLVPRDLHIGNAEFEALEVGTGIRIRILRSRFQINDPFIQAVAMYEGLAPAADGPAEVKSEAEAEAVTEAAAVASP